VGSGIWRQPFPGPFEELRQASFPNPFRIDHEGLIAYVASWSMVAALPDEAREPLLENLRALVPPGEYLKPLRTDLYWTATSSR
jgi:hypothetical protein